MAESLEEACRVFVRDVFLNETLFEDEKWDLIEEAMCKVARNVPMGSYPGPGLIMHDYIREARRPRKLAKNR